VDDFLIRPFEAAHRPGLVLLWTRCSLVRPWNDPDRDIDRKLAVADGLLLVAHRGPELVGSVMAGYDGHRGWINYLAVDPAERRGGVATALMHGAEERLRGLGCAKINLQIRRANADAVSFYESIGFVEDDVISLGKRLVRDDAGEH
jgi:ribosomal protein S18 acetylase RimI-like enzyme